MRKPNTFLEGTRRKEERKQILFQLRNIVEFLSSIFLQDLEIDDLFRFDPLHTSYLAFQNLPMKRKDLQSTQSVIFPKTLEVSFSRRGKGWGFSGDNYID
ncbi:MAG: hypothetical protein ACTSUR_06230 [Candidatus Heimdallarchaeaceae archaeon]